MSDLFNSAEMNNNNSGIDVSNMTAVEKNNGSVIRKKSFFNDTISCDYRLHYGKEHQNLLPKFLIFENFPETLKNNFTGCCYYCSQPCHSQNFCPIRQCNICLEYGHSSKVCHNVHLPFRRFTSSSFSSSSSSSSSSMSFRKPSFDLKPSLSTTSYSSIPLPPPRSDYRNFNKGNKNKKRRQQQLHQGSYSYHYNFEPRQYNQQHQQKQQQQYDSKLLERDFNCNSKHMINNNNYNNSDCTNWRIKVTG